MHQWRSVKPRINRGKTIAHLESKLYVGNVLVGTANGNYSIFTPSKRAPQAMITALDSALPFSHSCFCKWVSPYSMAKAQKKAINKFIVVLNPIVNHTNISRDLRMAFPAKTRRISQ